MSHYKRMRGDMRDDFPVYRFGCTGRVDQATQKTMAFGPIRGWVYSPGIVRAGCGKNWPSSMASIAFSCRPATSDFRDCCAASRASASVLPPSNASSPAQPEIVVGNAGPIRRLVLSAAVKSARCFVPRIGRIRIHCSLVFRHRFLRMSSCRQRDSQIVMD